MNIKNALFSNRIDGLSGLLVFSAIALISYFVMNLLALSVVALSLGKDVIGLAALIQNPEAGEGMPMAILLIQGIVSVFTFMAVPWLYIKLYEKSTVSEMLTQPPAFLTLLLLSVGLVYVTGPANTWLYEWNKNVVWPTGLEGFGLWAEESEAVLKKLTEYLVRFETIPEWITGIFVIAVVPAIGEELFFRGVMQYKFAQIFRNQHAAIWITAFIFSAIHFQFLGFLPRLFLGVLFGYIYVWSGSLWLSVLAHFINNLTTLAVMNMALTGKGGLTMETLEETSLSWTIVSLPVSAALLWYFYFVSHKRKPAEKNFMN